VKIRSITAGAFVALAVVVPGTAQGATAASAPSAAAATTSAPLVATTTGGFRRLSVSQASRAARQACRRVTQNPGTPYICRGLSSRRRLSRLAITYRMSIFDPNDNETCRAVVRVAISRSGVIRRRITRGSCALTPRETGGDSGGDPGTGPVYEGTDPIQGSGTLDASTAAGEANRMCQTITQNPRTGYVCNGTANTRADQNGTFITDLDIFDPNDGERCVAVARSAQSAPGQITTSVEQGTCQVRP
jgi:hypothetical protein